ncbi:MAG: hypothetical protein K6U80_19690 [Firmicutes bacterium]|nr:hypothetical protein [Bacillota bacterium]
MEAWIRIEKGIFKLLSVELFQEKSRILFRYLFEPNKYSSDFIDLDSNLIEKTMEYISSCIESGKVIDLRLSSVKLKFNQSQ